MERWPQELRDRHAAYKRMRYQTDPDYRERQKARVSRSRPVKGRGVVTSIQEHHCDEQMRCAADGEEWPCEPFKAARRAKPFGPLNIPVEEGRKVVAG